MTIDPVTGVVSYSVTALDAGVHPVSIRVDGNDGEYVEQAYDLTVIATPCVGLPAGEQCDDGDVCDGAGVCDALEECVQGDPPVIDDGRVCTIDTCDPIAGVSNVNMPGASCDDHGGVCDAHARCVHAPLITSAPPSSDIYVAPAVATQRQKLDAWHPETIYSPVVGTPHWTVAPNNEAVTEDNNVTPHVFLSDFSMGAEHLEGTLKCADDDGFGLVFNYQDKGHFYLFSWTQEGRANFLGNVASVHGMSIRAVDATTPQGEDLMKPGGFGNTTELYKTSVGYSSTTTYRYELDSEPGTFNVRIFNGATLVAETLEPIVDHTYTGGKFGFYSNYCEDATFTNLDRTRFPQASYEYDVDAVSEDPDAELVYSLVSAPVGMTIDAATGLIRWLPSARDLGPHTITVGVSSDGTHSQELSYTLTVVQGGACTGAVAGTPCPDDDVCNGSEICDGQGTCLPGTNLVVEDGDPCTTDACDPSTGVSHTPRAEGSDCDDGDACNGAEVCATQTTTPTFVQLSPRRTYLRESSGSVLDARPYPLADFGLVPGDKVTLTRAGSFVDGSYVESGLVAVFSTSITLLGRSSIDRVAGAVAPVGAAQYSTAGSGAGPTDIVQDFFVALAGTTVTVPPGAAYLFFSPADGDKRANTDLDGDWGVIVAKASQFGCQPGTPLVVDDGNACTLDVCDAGAVTHTSYPQGAATCEQLGAQCGSVGDGCGVQLDCGACAGGLICGSQAPNQCGAPALATAVVIDIPKAMNVARSEFGATIIEPPGSASAVNAIDALTSTSYTTASNPDPKVITVALMNAPQVVDHVAFPPSSPSSTTPRDFEIWVSDHEPFDTNAFERVLTASHTPGSAQFSFSFAPVKARYVRLVMINPGGTGSWSRKIDGFGVFTPERDGGIVSLLEGGASVVTATSQASTGDSPWNVIDANDGSLWRATGATNESIVIKLAPEGRTVTHVELYNGARASYPISVSPKDFEVSLSTTGTAPADFSTVLARTVPAADNVYVLEAAPRQKARYAKLLLKNGWGGPQVMLNTFRLYSDEVGGAVVSFGDRTDMPIDQVASSVWTFGDGTSSTEAHPRHTFPAPGTYEVSLTVTDVQGNVGVAHKTYTVLQAPVVSFDTSPSPVLESKVTAFKLVDTSQYAPGHGGVSFSWTSPSAIFIQCTDAGCFPIAGAATYLSRSAPVRYRQDGPTPTTLDVLDSQFLRASLTRDLNVVNSPPTVSAGDDVEGTWGTAIAMGVHTAAVDDEGDIDRGTLICDWTFGDGATQHIEPCTPTNTRAAHVYTDPGVYTATLNVRDDHDEVSDTVTVAVDRRPTHVIPIALVPTATDGDFELWAQLFDHDSDATSMPGQAIVFDHGGAQVTAITGSDSIARAVVHFDQLSYSTIAFSFAGDARYAPSAASLDYLVPEGAGTPIAARPRPGAHEGYTFVLAIPENSENQANTDPVRLELTARAPTQARVRIPAFGFDQTVGIAANKTTDVVLPAGVRMGENIPNAANDNVGVGGDIEDKGIEVTSAEPISVQGLSVIRGSTGAYLGLPLAALGTDYRVLAYPNEKWHYYASSSGTMAAIVATEDATHVTVLPTADTVAGPDLPQGGKRGVPFSITLDRLQTFQIVSRSGSPTVFEDLSGTRITSDKPIGVYGGHTCATIAGVACDNVVEMLPPVSHWGSHFVSAPLIRTHLKPDALRVLASEDGTELRINGVLVATLSAGEVHQHTLGSEQLHDITTSAPALAAQLAASPDFGLNATGDGDPLMMLLPPVTQAMNGYVVSTAPDTVLPSSGADQLVYTFSNHVNIVSLAQDAGSIRVDGNPVTANWLMSPVGEYAGTSVSVAPGMHTVSSTKPSAKLLAWTYGWQYYNGYGSPAGMQFDQGTCVPSQTIAGDGIDNDCDGVAEEELLDGEDNDGDGLKDEDLSAVHSTNGAPTLAGTSYQVGSNWTNRLPLLGDDPDGDALAYRIVSAPALGSATIEGSVVVYVPSAGASSYTTVTMTVAASDGQLESAPATLTLTYDPGGCRTPLPGVTRPCNHWPYMWAIDYGNSLVRVPVNGSAFYRAWVHAQDFDHDELRYELLTAPPGLTIDAQTGEMTWLVHESDIGSWNILAQVWDENGGHAHAGWKVVVQSAAIGGAPVITSVPVTAVAAGQAYVYPLVASDPEGGALGYKLLSAPVGMTISNTGLITWQTGPEEDAQQHSVVVVVSDAQGLQTVQTFNVTVGSPTLEFTSEPVLTAVADLDYRYDVDVVDRSGSGSPVHYEFLSWPEGMLMGYETGVITWTPTQAQVGTHSVVVVATTDTGARSEQHFVVEVAELPVAPTITSEPVTTAVLQGLYFYDVDGADFGLRERLTYSLVSAPPGMQIDPTTGVIQWIADHLGTELVTVRVTDAGGFFQEQQFAIEVSEDTTAPLVTVTASAERITSGVTVTLSVQASDDVLVTSYALTVNGQPVALDGENQATYTATAPGLYSAIATVTDSSGHTTTAAAHFSVTTGTDTIAPALTLSSPLEDSELTYIHDIVGSVSDAVGVFRTTLSERKRGASAWRVIGAYYGAATNGVLGQIDTTLLENGYHELRVEVEDLDGNKTSLVRPVRVSGQAKVGVVQMSFVDAALPVAGIPVTVVRTYDSRRKDVRGEFGYGWSLDIKRGGASHNRAVGDGWGIYTGQDDSFPCQRVAEQKSHFTEIRLSDREQYIFRAVVVPPGKFGGVSGHCNGHVLYDFVDGTMGGADLVIVGDNEVLSFGYYQAQPFTSEGQLVKVSNSSEVFDPQELQLRLPDGRIYDINVNTGITAVRDRHGNALTFQNSGVYSGSGTGITFERDSQGRVNRLIDPSGQTVDYSYDLNGDLVSVLNQNGDATQLTYKRTAELKHHLDKVYGADGRELAKLDYDSSGRLKRACDADGGCAQSSYDLQQRQVVQTDATEVLTHYEYDLSGNVTSQTDGLGRVTLFEYDGYAHVTRAQGPDGSVATYTYDRNGNLLTRVLPHAASEPAADFTYLYTYNARNDRTSVTLPSGGAIAYDYDAAGNQTAVKDGDGNVIASRTYNADGTLATRTDRFGTTTYNGYVNGQPAEIVDAHGVEISLDYDNNGRLLSRIERGQVTTMAYDDLGRTTQMDYGNGSTVDFEYSLGKADWTKISGPTFGTVSRTFTAKGLLSSWKEPNGDEFVRRYDGAGRVKEEIDALGNRTTYGYDAAGRLKAITDVTLNATTMFERDAAGRVTKTTDALGHETHDGVQARRAAGEHDECAWQAYALHGAV